MSTVDRSAFSRTQLYVAHKLVRALTESTSDAQVRTVAERAMPEIAAMDNEFQRTFALAVPVVALAAVGDRGGALRLAEPAERIALAIGYPENRAKALAALGKAVAAAGDRGWADHLLDHAEQVALSIDFAQDQVSALGAVVEVLAGFGDRTGALRVAALAERAAFAECDQLYRARSLADLSVIMADIGELAKAEQLAANAPDPYYAGISQQYVALMLASQGQVADARRVVRSMADQEMAEDVSQTLDRALVTGTFFVDYPIGEFNPRPPGTSVSVTVPARPTRPARIGTPHSPAVPIRPMTPAVHPPGTDRGID